MATFKFTLIFKIVACFITVGSQEFFSRLPNPDYFKRDTIFDCQLRFHPPKTNSYKNDDDWSEPAVSGGERVYNGEYQHMAAIGWIFEDKVHYLCGGTLLTDKFVLTAAHCVAPVEGIYPSIVRLGDTDLGNSQYDFDVQQFDILRIKRHPLHRHAQRYHDIALIQLNGTVRFTKDVCPACLWLEEEVPPGPLHIVGFGEKEFGGGLSDTLQQGQVSHVALHECVEQIGIDRRIPDGLMDSQLCASNPVMDTCQGDSGGPIEVRRIDLNDLQYPMVVGVTSFGTPCVNGSKGIYTKVSHYLDWIESETNDTFTYDKCLSRCTIRQSGANAVGVQTIPGVVYLLETESTDSFNNCTGSLIDDRFVLTSAFCASYSGRNVTYIYVPSSKETILIDEIFTHPLYQMGNSTYDISILKLTKYLKQNVTVKPICIKNDNSNNLGLMQFVLEDHNRFERNSTAYYTKSIFGLDEQCPERKNHEEICVENETPFIPRACKIFHGGPILDGLEYPVPYLYGIVSQKTSGCDRRLYGTRVESHIDWIQSVVFKMWRNDEYLFS